MPRDDTFIKAVTKTARSVLELSNIDPECIQHVSLNADYLIIESVPKEMGGKPVGNRLVDLATAAGLRAYYNDNTETFRVNANESDLSKLGEFHAALEKELEPRRTSQLIEAIRKLQESMSEEQKVKNTIAILQGLDVNLPALAAKLKSPPITFNDVCAHG